MVGNQGKRKPGGLPEEEKLTVSRPEDQTLEPGNSSGEPPGARRPGTEVLGHYRLVRMLGKGGMGEVFEAEDLRLGRRVAIKFLKSGSPEQVARFIREARAQASVEHEHLCKLYEVGEGEQGPYIVMQLIQGDSLADMTDDLTLEQKLLVMQKSAEALHAAHRAGLVHRDLKPGNIMLEQTSGGELKPYVLDFGLARVAADDDLTVTGEILGTPCYMAPEQARGEINMDRRTDVYGLGATLYYLLLDQPPFANASFSSLILDILAKEPRKPRELAPGLPKDVETIVVKCLEKKREDRYESAHALAEDLRRYLNSEPILARPASKIYRLGKWLNKHKLVASISAVAIFLLFLSLGWGAWRASSRERLARELTGQVKEVEALARHAYLTRRHDIRPLHDQLLRRMDLVRGRMARGGSQARGPGNYALGWGYLVLGRTETARGYLDQAWRSGDREPEVAYALGLAYSNLYRRELEAARRIEDAEERAKKEETARVQLRDPALDFLKLAQSSEAASAQYLSGLIAYFEGRYQDALAPLAEVLANRPWFYEARGLEADIYRDWAMEQSAAGKTELAREYFDRSLDAYLETIEIGQSDPTTYKAMARALQQLMSMDMYGREELAAYLERGLDILAQVREVLPDDGEALLQEAGLRRNFALRLRIEGKDPTRELASAVEAANRALASDLQTSQTYLELGALYWQWAQWQNDQNTASEDKVAKAVAALEKVAPEKRDYSYFFFLGSAHRSLAKSRGRRGEDARPDYTRAIEALRHAERLRPDGLEGLNSLAICLYHLSSQTGMDPIPPLREAVSYLEKAVAINPNHVVLRYQLARTLLRLAQDGRPGMGKLDDALTAAALAQLEKGLELNPKIVSLYSQIGWVWLLRAQHAWEHGQSPDPFFEKAIAICESGLERVSQTRSLLHHLATTHYFRGKYRIRQGESPGKELDWAEERARQVLAASPGSEAYLILGSVERLRAELWWLQGKDPSILLEDARQAFQKILTLNPDHAEAYRSLGRLHTLESQWHLQSGQDPGPALAKAREYLGKALARQPESPYFLLAEARWFIAYADWKGDVAGFEDRLERLADALAQREDLPEAMAALASLPHNHEVDREKAMASAVSANPYLSFEWQRARAKKL